LNGAKDMEKSKTEKQKIKQPKTTAWWIKTVVFGLLLIGASCFLGLVLRLCGDRSMQLISGSGGFGDLLRLGCLALGALITVAVAAGIIAVLIRSFWVAAIMVLISALALFLCWGISLPSFVVALIYFIMGLIYLAGVRTEIKNRIKFSTWNIRSSQSPFLLVLAALVCAGLYFGYAKSIDRNGFSLSPSAVNSIMNIADDYGIDRVASIMGAGTLNGSDRQEALTQLRDYLENDINSHESYADYAPVLIAAGAFAVLSIMLSLLSWLPPLILWLIFLILLRLNVIKKNTQMVEITRLGIE
jgi:hypothetical protein